MLALVEPRTALTPERVRRVRDYVRRHYGHIEGQAFSSSAVAGVDDLVQIALIGIWLEDRKRPGRFDREPKLLWCVVRGAIADYLRVHGGVTRSGRVKMRMGVSLDTPISATFGTWLGEVLDGTTWAEVLVDRSILAQGDMADRVNCALEELPPRERSVVTLTVVHGYHQHELGEQMGVSEARVGQIRQRGLKRMARDPGLVEWAAAA